MTTVLHEEAVMINLGNLLHRLFESVGGSHSPASTREQRGTWRVQRRLALPALRADGSELRLLAVNFGTGGIRVEPAIRLERGEVLEILAPYPGHTDARFSVEVVWCRARSSDQRLEAGLKFKPSQGKAARAAARFLLEECKVSVHAAQEHRRAPRLSTYRLKVTCALADRTPLSGNIADLATGGVLCVLGEKLARGTRAALRLDLQDGKAALECQGEVVRCKSAGLGDRFEIAFAFVQPTPEHREHLVSYLEGLMSRIAEGLQTG